MLDLPVVEDRLAALRSVVVQAALLSIVVCVGLALASVRKESLGDSSTFSSRGYFLAPHHRSPAFRAASTSPEATPRGRGTHVAAVPASWHDAERTPSPSPRSAGVRWLRDRHLAGGASQHTAPPVRRSARWGPSRSVGRLAETAEEAAHRRRLGDERDEAHASAAAWTCEDVDRKAALEELGPRSIAGSGGLGRRIGPQTARAGTANLIVGAVVGGVGDRRGGRRHLSPLEEPVGKEEAPKAGVVHSPSRMSAPGGQGERWSRRSDGRPEPGEEGSTVSRGASPLPSRVCLG